MAALETFLEWLVGTDNEVGGAGRVSQASVVRGLTVGSFINDKA